MNDARFRAHARHIVVAWVALLLLMLTSLASSYVPLGWGNAAAGAVIATIKSGIVVVLFMGLLRERVVVRIVAAAALGTWCLLLVLGGLDELTRPQQPAVFQQPHQLGGTR